MKRLLYFCLLFLSVAAFAARPYVAPVCPSTPTGYYVNGKQLFSPSDSPVPLHGLNNVHWDQFAARTGIPLAGANAVRLVMDFNQSTTTNQSVVDPFISTGMVTILGNWAATCKTDAASLVAIGDTWVKQASTWTQPKYQSTLINIANEWGPGSTTSTPVPYKANAITPNYTWRDTYIATIVRMRAAGYMQAIVVDAGGCGQDAQTVIRDGAAVLAGDPQHNVLFDVHVYGGFYRPATAAWQQDYATAFKALGASGLAIIIGEYGPGLNVGPSPTTIAPEQIMSDVMAQGLVGDLAWAYNDNNLGGCKTSDTGWFGMTNSCSTFTGKTTELTAFGRKMVPLLRAANGLAPLPGWQ